VEWGFLTGSIVFIGIWIYALATWGLLLGLIFGWIPALIGGFIAGLFWPIIALAVIGIAILIYPYSKNNTHKTITKTSIQPYNTLVTNIPTNNPHLVGIINNTKTLIVCNLGNKKIFTATETKITFTGSDFAEDYLPDDKRVALNKVCEITPHETQEVIADLWDNKITPPLFEVKPVYK